MAHSLDHIAEQRLETGGWDTGRQTMEGGTILAPLPDGSCPAGYVIDHSYHGCVPVGTTPGWDEQEKDPDTGHNIWQQEDTPKGLGPFNCKIWERLVSIGRVKGKYTGIVYLNTLRMWRTTNKNQKPVLACQYSGKWLFVEAENTVKFLQGVKFLREHYTFSYFKDIWTQHGVG